MWSKQDGDRRYEVRSAGRTVRLYTDGVFHSQYNPGRVLDGSLWDLLSLPALLHPEGSLRRVLVLGVGGGAIIHHLDLLLRSADGSPEIVGVDLDAVHLDVAQQWFGVTPDLATLIEADAITWLASYRGAGFDLIVDDLFGEAAGEPVRAVSLDAQWEKQLRRVLNPQGIVVVNSLDCRALRAPGFFSTSSSRYRCRHPHYENCVGVFTDVSASIRRWRQHVRQHTQLGAAQKRHALELSMSRL